MGYVKAQGHTLKVGDFVRHEMVWFKLTEIEDTTRYSVRFLGVDKNGARRHLLIDGTRGYQAYVHSL